MKDTTKSKKGGKVAILILLILGILAGGIYAIVYFFVPLKVNFLNFDGKVYEQQSVKRGENATLPKENPEREGYTFSGWDYDGKAITKSKNIQSKWVANKYTISFDANDGTISSDSKEVSYDSEFGELETPTREGFAFVGWRTDAEEIVESTTILKTSSNLTLHAYWLKDEAYLSKNWRALLFDSPSDASKINSINITKDKSEVFANVNPIIVGVVSIEAGASTWTNESEICFIYAYLKAVDNDKYDVVFYSPATIYAPVDSSNLFANTSGISESSLTSISLSNLNTSKVTDASKMFYNCDKLTSLDLSNFDLSKTTNTESMLGGCKNLVEIKTPKSVSDKTIELTSTENYSWYDEANTKNTYSALNATNINKTLVKKGAIVQVTFNPNGGNLSTTKYDYFYNSEYGSLPLPDHPGYTFLGWFTEATGGYAVSKITKVTQLEPYTLYARWDLVAYNLLIEEGPRDGNLNSNDLYSTTNYVIVTRIASEYKKATIGQLFNGDKIYYGDKIKIVTNNSYYQIGSNKYYTYNNIWVDRKLSFEGTSSSARSSDRGNESVIYESLAVYGNITIRGERYEKWRTISTSEIESSWIRNESQNISRASLHELVNAGFNYRVSGKVSFGTKKDQDDYTTFTNLESGNSWTGSVKHAGWTSNWTVWCNENGVTFTGGTMGAYYGKGTITQIDVYY